LLTYRHPPFPICTTSGGPLAYEKYRKYFSPESFGQFGTTFVRGTGIAFRAAATGAAGSSARLAKVPIGCGWLNPWYRQTASVCG
jgi:hypothetical protein